MARLRSALLVLGLAAATVVALEALARLAFFVAGDVLGLGASDELPEHPAFELVDYDAAALFAEQEAGEGAGYEPYALWRARPYAGSLYRVGADGRRETRPSADAEDALVVWMFGGSTLFGAGAPDGETIPSHLARLLGERGTPARVSNFGQPGYVTTQELVALLRQLQVSPAPDAVVFYDGYNDAVAARHWPEVPGAHFHFDRIRARYESGLAPLVFSSALFRGVEYAVAGGLGAEREPAPRPGAPPPGELAARLWLRDAELAAALARQLGFVHLSLFQPTLALGGKPLHPSERALVPGRHQALEDMHRGIREHLERHGEGPVHDLTDAFAATPEPLYYDFAHVTGLGNRIVAERIAGLLEAALAARSRPPGPP
jgi:hypothetical protein